MKSPGTPFFAAGIMFLIIALATGKIVVFLPIGIALIIVGIGIIRRGQKSQ